MAFHVAISCIFFAIILFDLVLGMNFATSYIYMYEIHFDIRFHILSNILLESILTVYLT